MMEKPKECPFCGSVNITNSCGYSDKMYFYQQCWECRALGPRADDSETALKLWNTRPALKLICPDCGERLVKNAIQINEFISEDGKWVKGYLCGCKQ